ncbi:MAG TPA: hypothetical protein ENJ95_21460 [Bacteroidetes bacterium]|nr:hypothetical protein [Bacteroidota bacterium]
MFHPKTLSLLKIKQPKNDYERQRHPKQIDKHLQSIGFAQPLQDRTDNQSWQKAVSGRNRPLVGRLDLLQTAT